jgi:Ca2+-transporting ATPase
LQELSDYDGETHPGHGKLLDTANYDKVESNLIFVGMAGLRVSTPL